MDKKDAWLLELYEGSGTPSDSDPGSTDEAASLREMKDWMDARSTIRSARPDPEAVEAVLQAAAQHDQPTGAQQDQPTGAQQDQSTGARQDRPALSRKRAGWRAPRRIAGGAIAAMLAVVAVVGLFRADVFAPTSTDSEPVALRPAAPASTETAPAEAFPETLSPAGEAEGLGADVQRGNTGLAAASSDLSVASGARPPETAPQAPSPPVLAASASADAAGPLQSAAVASEQAEEGTLAEPEFVLVEIPAWDDQSDVIYLQQRIQHIGDGVAGGWETPAVPLEMLPVGSGNPGLTPASERR